jgi:hypothetical protein
MASVMAWKVDPALLEIMKDIINECEGQKPKESCSIQVEMNSLLCALVDQGLVDLLRKSGTGKRYWGPTEMFWQAFEKSQVKG